VARATGISYSTIVRGLQELKSPRLAPPNRIRRSGGGRKKTLQKDPALVNDLENLVEPVVSGDPQSPLRWTSKSVRTLSKALRGMGHVASHQLVAELLCAAGYSLHCNRKGREGPNHPDRDGQFRYINGLVRAFQAKEQPVISVDTKKKELVGDFKKRWERLEAEEKPARCSGPRLHHSREWQGYSLWGLRPDAQCGVGQRGHRPRHSEFRSPHH